jgi:hypothetical protein
MLFYEHEEQQASWKCGEGPVFCIYIEVVWLGVMSIMKFSQQQRARVTAMAGHSSSTFPMV